MPTTRTPPLALASACSLRKHLLCVLVFSGPLLTVKMRIFALADHSANGLRTRELVKKLFRASGHDDHNGSRKLESGEIRFARRPSASLIRVKLTGQLLLRDSRVYTGEYFFFIYMLEKAALKLDLQMVPVLVKFPERKVHVLDEVSEWFRSRVPFAEANGKVPFRPDADVIQQTLHLADEYMDMIREEEERSLKRMNDSVIENKIESVRQTASMKVRRAEETLSKLVSEGHGGDDSIIRLHKGRIRNLEAHAEEAIHDLEARRAAAVSFRLIAGGHLTVAD